MSVNIVKSSYDIDIKVPFSALDKLLKEVIEEAEGHYKHWPMVG